jgi:hypothetical protein
VAFLEHPPLKRLALVVIVVIPLLAWFIVKPVRVVLPKFAGVTCVSTLLCLDDPSRSEEARALVLEAMSFVGSEVAEVQGSPKFIFCASQECADRFGLGPRQAVTMGTYGTVIGPRAWTPSYVRHELIHYVQARKLGVLTLLTKPTWFVEGMAYALSGDPRDRLAEPFDGYRKRFFAWYRAVGKELLWREAEKL